jgi:hypothetical protein
VKRACLLLLSVLATCAPQGFKSASLVDTVRVLAVQAELPFAEPGENVNLRALVVDPRGGGRELRFAFATCTNPGSAELAACVAGLGPFEETVVPPDGEPTFSVRVPDGALPSDAPIGSVGVVFAACAGRFSVAARPEGAPLGCVDATDHVSLRDAFFWGVKRITVLRGARNANPVVGAVAIDGHRWDEGFDVALDPCVGTRVDDCPAEKQHTLDVQIAKETAEPYLDRTEDVVTFFYTSQGALHDEVARATDWDFPNIYAPVGVDPSRPIDVWVVVRDDRGGVGWAHRTATLR